MSSGAATSLDTRSQIWESLNPAQREIRLFIVEPDKDEIAIAKGRLITRSLEQHLFYDAVSHAWGSHSDAEALIINGAEWLVTTSIYEALQRLREPEREKCIWIDALCINQHDLQDRAQQVSMHRRAFLPETFSTDSATSSTYLGEDYGIYLPPSNLRPGVAREWFLPNP